MWNHDRARLFLDSRTQTPIFPICRKYFKHGSRSVTCQSALMEHFKMSFTLAVGGSLSSIAHKAKYDDFLKVFLASF